MSGTAKTIQGRDTQIRVFRNGSLIDVVEINNFEAKEDADFKRSEYLGNTNTTGDIVFKGWSGSFDAEKKNAVVDDLIDSLIEENLGRLNLSDLTIQDTETYRDGTRAAWVYYGVQLKYSKNASSRDEKVKSKIEWQADYRKRIF